jgi:hypothetical protein
VRGPERPATPGTPATTGPPPSPTGSEASLRDRDPAKPPTLSLVLSRRARREAAAAAVRDPRLDVIERVLTGFQIAGNALALVLSAVGWGWLAVHASGTAAQAPGALTNDAAGAATSGPALLHPLAALSGTTLVLIMLPTCLLMAPSVNPFYAPPPERRLLHTGHTVAFAVLAVSTVAVIAGAAR